MSLTVILSFVVTTIISALMIPLVNKAGNQLGIVAHMNKRTVHKHEIARIGGYAIYLSSLIGSALFLKADHQINAIMVAGFIIFMVGLYDDSHDLSPKVKLIFEVIAALIVIVYGEIYIKGFGYFPSDAMTFLSGVVTLFWIVGITNAINLIDGLDGLSSGISLISCISLLIIFATNGSTIFSIILITALAGGIVGFLPFNFNPAKTFVGDVGSNFLGFSLAVISILGVAKTYTVLVLIAPLIVLGLPIFDTIFAIFRRIIKGKSLKAVFKPDKGHLHHRLMAKGYTQKQAVLILYGLSATLGMFAIILLNSSLWKALSFAMLIVAIVAIGYKDIFKTNKKHEE